VLDDSPDLAKVTDLPAMYFVDGDEHSPAALLDEVGEAEQLVSQPRPGSVESLYLAPDIAQCLHANIGDFRFDLLRVMLPQEPRKMLLDEPIEESRGSGFADDQPPAPRGHTRTAAINSNQPGPSVDRGCEGVSRLTRIVGVSVRGRRRQARPGSTAPEQLRPDAPVTSAADACARPGGHVYWSCSTCITRSCPRGGGASGTPLTDRNQIDPHLTTAPWELHDTPTGSS
jgi:hypothetical protein